MNFVNNFLFEKYFKLYENTGTSGKFSIKMVNFCPSVQPFPPIRIKTYYLLLAITFIVNFFPYGKFTVLESVN